MFLKIIIATIRLPHIVTQQNSSYYFPRVAELPSVCVEEFTEEGGKGLIAKAPKVFAIATKAEVDAAKRVAASAPDKSVEKLAFILTIKAEDIVAGTVTVKDFLALGINDQVALLKENTEIPLETLQQLVAFAEGPGKADKSTVRLLKETVHQRGKGAQ